jgi:NAD(P)H-dependent FMN reductase
VSLNVPVILGSVRESTPPRPARLGLRVARACMRWLADAGHAPALVDPLDVPRAAAFKPHFAYPAGQAPEPLERLAAQLGAADGYVMVSPEYNHSMSPALADLLNHFGSSRFAFRPSLIVTYSAGQWGGARAAVSMRTFLSELGCLPVSAMVHVPRAQEVFDEDGQVIAPDPAAWHSYLGRGMAQLIWWAQAALAQRAAHGNATPAFRRSPADRNAP